jgi:hypothetical protein
LPNGQDLPGPASADIRHRDSLRAGTGGRAGLGDDARRQGAARLAGRHRGGKDRWRRPGDDRTGRPARFGHHPTPGPLGRHRRARVPGRHRPQPGEQFSSPLPATRVGHKPVLVPSDDDRPPPIPWDQAHNHVGRTITVEGTVVSTSRRGKVCFLNFTENWRGKFYVILFEGALAGWPQPPEQYFLNRRIRIWGKVSLHKDVPQLQVRSTRQITVVEDPRHDSGRTPADGHRDRHAARSHQTPAATGAQAPSFCGL